jgi:hypothetical protein
MELSICGSQHPQMPMDIPFDQPPFVSKGLCPEMIANGNMQEYPELER